MEEVGEGAAEAAGGSPRDTAAAEEDNEKREEDPSTSGGGIQRLPGHLLMKILRRAAPELPCRKQRALSTWSTVCKQWRTAVSDPEENKSLSLRGAAGGYDFWRQHAPGRFAKLVFLHAFGAQLSSGGLETVAACCKGLETLWCEACPHVTGLGLAAVVQGCPRLKALRAHSCDLQFHDLQPLVDGLRSSAGTGLVQLDLSCNSFPGSHPGLSGPVADICIWLASSPPLQILSLYKCELQSSGVEMLGAALAHNTRLREIDLSANYTVSEYVSEQAWTAVAAGLAQNTTLRRLAARLNGIGRRAGEALAAAAAPGCVVDLEGNLSNFP